MRANPYLRKAQYYETDQMGIIHHANYIHWFEEARIDFMEQMGFGYKKMEELGVQSPVLAMACEYKRSVSFDDMVEVHCRFTQFDGVRMTVGYEVIDHESKELKATGESRHCYINRNGRPVSLKKAIPELYTLCMESFEIND